MTSSASVPAPKSSGSYLAKQAILYLAQQGIDVQPQVAIQLRIIFTNAARRDPQAARNGFDDFMFRFAQAARQLNVQKVNVVSLRRIRELICPLYPWCK